MNRQSIYIGLAGNKTSTRPHFGLAASALALLLLSGCASNPQTNSTISSTPQTNNAPITDSKELKLSQLRDHSSSYYGKPAHSSKLTQKDIRAMFVQSRTLVTKNTGAELSHIKLVFASDREIGDEVLSETRRLVNSQFSNSSFASHFLNAVMSSQEGTYAALFATERAEVMISTTLLHNYLSGLPEDYSIRRAAVKALLIHELVHAADDVNYGIHANRELNFRASFAQSATFEGHAQWLTRKLCKKANCSSGLDALDNFMFSRGKQPNQLTQSVQAVSRNVLEYSYVEGEHFMQKIAARPDGDRLIEQLLANPPQDPIQILDPASYPNVKRENRNQNLLMAADKADHHWRETPWALVQTSPLKGVNLRAEPGKREAAIDGFTRLITSMVAAQLYNIEITIMQTDRNNTAALFAQTLHENTITVNTETDRFKAAINANKGSISGTPAVNILLTSELLEDNSVYHSVVSRAGSFVIQVAGFGDNANEFIEYSVDVLSNLYGVVDTSKVNVTGNAVDTSTATGTVTGTVTGKVTGTGSSPDDQARL